MAKTPSAGRLAATAAPWLLLLQIAGLAQAAAECDCPPGYECASARAAVCVAQDATRDARQRCAIIECPKNFVCAVQSAELVCAWAPAQSTTGSAARLVLTTTPRYAAASLEETGSENGTMTVVFGIVGGLIGLCALGLLLRCASACVAQDKEAARAASADSQPRKGGGVGAYEKQVLEPRAKRLRELDPGSPKRGRSPGRGLAGRAGGGSGGEIDDGHMVGREQV